MLTEYERKDLAQRRVEQNLKYAISNYTRLLKRKVEKEGLYENFGEKERFKLERALSDWSAKAGLTYSDLRTCHEMIDEFCTWAMNYEG